MQVGILLAFNSLGYLLACSFTGWLARKAGMKLTLAFGSMVISGVCIYFAANYTSLSSAYFLMYVGNGILEIALAILAARIFIKNTGTMMNLAHFFYGLSSTFAPVIAASLMGAPVFGSALDWRGMYMLMLALPILPLLPGLFARYTSDEEKHEERISLKEYARDKIAWIIVAVLSFGVISELAIGGWLINFLEKAYGWSGDASGKALHEQRRYGHHLYRYLNGHCRRHRQPGNRCHYGMDETAACLWRAGRSQSHRRAAGRLYFHRELCAALLSHLSYPLPYAQEKECCALIKMPLHALNYSEPQGHFYLF